MEGENLTQLLSRVIGAAREKIQPELQLAQTPSPGIWLNELEARILVAAAQSTLDRLRSA